MKEYDKLEFYVDEPLPPNISGVLNKYNELYFLYNNLIDTYNDLVHDYNELKAILEEVTK